MEEESIYRSSHYGWKNVWPKEKEHQPQGFWQSTNTGPQSPWKGQLKQISGHLKKPKKKTEFLGDYASLHIYRCSNRAIFFSNNDVVLCDKQRRKSLLLFQSLQILCQTSGFYKTSTSIRRCNSSSSNRSIKTACMMAKHHGNWITLAKFDYQNVSQQKIKSNPNFELNMFQTLYEIMCGIVEMLKHVVVGSLGTEIIKYWFSDLKVWDYNVIQ